MTIEERAEKWGKDYPKLPLGETPYTDNDIEAIATNSFLQGATEQQRIDIENCVKWCEEFNKNGERIGDNSRIDIDSVRMFITDIIMPRGMWTPLDGLIDEIENNLKG